MEGVDFQRETDAITQLNINLQGDLADMNESTIIGNVAFAPVNLPASPKTYMNPSNTQLPHLNVENLWPDKVVFHTLDAPAPEGYTFSMTNVDGAINKNNRDMNLVFNPMQILLTHIGINSQRKSMEVSE